MESTYYRQYEIFHSCMKKLKFEHIDHIIPWSKECKTAPDNLQMLCNKYNLDKSNKPFDIDIEKNFRSSIKIDR